ncbi:MAG: methyltransferase domain-containing protein [Desulfuromonadales bacterium]
MSGKNDAEDIRSAVREKYRKAAESVSEVFAYPTGREGAEKLGYDSDLIASAPAALLDTFCGVGCPYSLAGISRGERVLDIGCGGGFDLFCAARMVGPEGKVFGIDLSEEMIEKARKNLDLAGASNAHTQVGHSERLPFEDDEFDVVISNGALNLSPEKQRTYSEMWRVLRPGGRLQFADMVLKDDLPAEKMTAEAWSQ